MKLYHGKYPIEDKDEYVIDYVYSEQIETFYYQLVRIEDDAILCSAMSQDYIMLECWKRGIPYSKTAII